MPTRVFTFFFAVLWFLPAVFAFFQLDSYTISTVCIILLFNIAYYVYNNRVVFTRFFVLLMMLLFSFILIHTIVTRFYFYVGYDLIRNLISVFFLFIFLLGAFNFSRVLLQLQKFATRLWFCRR